MPAIRTVAWMIVLALPAPGTACGDRPGHDKTATPVIGSATPASGQAEHYSSAGGKFDIALPGVWKGRYRVEERRDATAGARLAVDFKFQPEAGSRAPAFTLMVIRVFPRDAWLRLERTPGDRIAAKLAERGDDVFGMSLPSSNPYPAGSREAATFDEMILAIARDGQQARLTPRP